MTPHLLVFKKAVLASAVLLTTLFCLSRPARAQPFISIADDRVSASDNAADRVTGTVPNGSNPVAFGQLPDSQSVPIIYGGNAYERRSVIEINLAENASRKVGDLLFDTQAIAQDPATGFVYYFEWDTSGDELAYWDPVTDTNVTVRAYITKPWSKAKRAAFDHFGDLYLMDEVDQLFQIDTATGDWEFIGQVEGIQSGPFFAGTGDIAFSPENSLYLADDDSLYLIDVAALQATLLFTDMLPGWSWEVWSGLAFCDGSLYASNVSVLGANSTIFSIDLSDGTVTGLIDTETMINDLSSCPAGTGPIEVAKGDVNNSGAVDLVDVIIAIQVAVGVSPDETVFVEADVDADGNIGIPEVIFGLQKTAGLR